MNWAIFRRLQSASLALAIVVAGMSTALAQSNTSAPAPYVAKAAAATTLRLDPNVAPATRIVFDALDANTVEAVKRANTTRAKKLLQIGIARKLPASAANRSASLQWTAVAGGFAAQWEVSSPGARALRIELTAARMQSGSEIRFAGRGEIGVVYGPVSAQEVRLAGTTYWSPVLEGDRAIVEVFVAAGTSPANLALEVTQLSSLIVSPKDPKAESLAKAAEACEVNLICRSASDPALASAGRAVARMVFSRDGASYLCTGTLLNPADGTFTPYFYSAAHCISTQEAASTLTTFWFYDAPSCTATSASGSVQLTGGATLLFANEASDAMLLRLNNSPPGGSVYAAWNADTVPVGAAVTAVHHPDGDVKKVSLGTISGFGVPSSDHGSFIIARWLSTATGVTEGGSSGSGIFTAIGQPASLYQFRGGLLGGPSSCTATPAELIDYYSRFDQAYQYLAMYLNPASTSCSYSLSPATRTASGAGASGTIMVTTQPGCAWSSTSTASWIAALTNGVGSGTASYAVDANDGNSSRTGTVLVGGQAFTVSQEVQPSTGTALIANGGFEAGATSWTQSSTANLPIITQETGTAHAGSWDAWLGGYESGTDTLTQTVTIPANAARATLRFWYRVESEETGTTARDTMSVGLLNASGTPIATLANYSNLDDTGGHWVQSPPYDVLAYRGQTVRLRFSATNDANNTTSFRVDDVALNAAATNYTALWWNPSESGWGVNLVHQGDIVFATLFTYDANGHVMWLVMSNGAKQAGSETFTGELYQTVGPAFNATPFTAITFPGNYTRVGSMTLSFSGPGAATLTYSVNGANVTKAVQKLVYGAQAADCEPTTSPRNGLTNYQDLWWNAAESGWGLNLTHQGDTLFGTLFTYDGGGSATNPGLWLVMSAGVKQPDGSYLGDLYQTVGPAFNATPFTPITSANYTRVGAMRLVFSDGANGTLTYSVNGANVVKTITRLVFSSPVPACSG